MHPVRRHTQVLVHMVVVFTLVLGLIPLTRPVPAQAAQEDVHAAGRLVDTILFEPHPRTSRSAPAASEGFNDLPFELPDTATSIAELIPSHLQTITGTLHILSGEETAVVDTSGAGVTFFDGQVAVIADDGTFAEPITLTFRLVHAGPVTTTSATTPTSPLSNTYGYTETSNPEEGALRFEIEAELVNGGTSVNTFDKEFYIAVDLREIVTATRESWYLAYRDPQDSTVWYGVQTRAYDKDGLITGLTDHLSYWSAGEEPTSWQFTWQEPTISAFSGAATFHYPVAVPPGRGGLQPNIDISYSSRGVDGSVLSGDNQGMLGMGWSMTEIAISRERIHLHDDDAHVRLVHPDHYSLVLNGTGYELKTDEDTSNAVVRYYVTNGPQLYVERRYDHSATDANVDRIYWIVRTADGTTYRLGYTPDSAVMQYMGYGLIDTEGSQHEGERNNYSGSRWLVDTVTDMYGNQAQYFYEGWEERDDYMSKSGTGSSSTTYHKSLLEIHYNFANRASDPNTRVGGNYGTRIHFWKTADHRIDQIRFYHLDLNQPYHILDLVPDTVWHHRCGQSTQTQLQRRIVEYNGAGTTILPPVRFTYTTLPHVTGDCYRYEYLEEVNNGYGGRTRFTYGITDNRHGDKCGGHCVPGYGQTWLATLKETWDGIHAEPVEVAYDYATPCYNQYNTDNGRAMGNLEGAFNCPTRDGGTGYGYGDLVGFQVVTRTVRGYDGSVLSRQRFNFSQGRYTMGQPTLEEILDGSDQTLASTQTSYTSGSNGPTVFYRPDVVTSTQYGQGTQVSTRVTYAYDGFGNVTQEIVYDDQDIPYRRTLRGYHTPRTDLWVNKPKYENVYHWGGSDWEELDSSVGYTYDGHLYYHTPLDRGELTVARHWQGGLGEDVRLVDTRYTYDEWGNQTAVTTYSDYGSSSEFASADPQTTTTTYDSTYHMFPLSVCNPLQQCSHTEYYGVEGVGLDGGLPGQVRREWGPNGLDTAVRYTYDVFGRPRKIVRPGDTLDAPSETYSYYDLHSYRLDHWPMMVARTVRGTGTNPYYWPDGWWERTFYDGLGRVVQTQQPADDWDPESQGHDVVAYTMYDGLGRAITQSVPYLVDSYVYSATNGIVESPYQEPDLNQLHTTNEYDALGRVTRVINTDGTETNMAYSTPGGWVSLVGRGVRQEQVQDANGHWTYNTYDAFGRLAWVGQRDADQGPLFVTLYDYDVLGNLTQVTSGGDVGNGTYTAGTIVTTMEYDPLGRKTAMDDPDMGQWTYEYDVAGNLITQTDALNQEIVFCYDELGRLVRRESDGVVLAAYGYDSGTYGIGRRTAMTDATGTATWTYDVRGQVTQETRTIAGQGPYTLQYTYDPLGRVRTITYPSGEVVTSTYGMQGAPETLVGYTTYVEDVAYNARGQIEQIKFGENLQTNYSYIATNFRLNVLRTGTDSSPSSLQWLVYNYDNVGNVTSINDRQAPGGSQVQTFTYDALNRLTDAETTGGSAETQYDHVYEYNGIGNIISFAGAEYDYNDPDHVHAVTHVDGVERYQYDANGNMIHRIEDDATYEQHFDVENRLAVVTNTVSGAVSEFFYDGDGALVMKRDPSGTTYYVGELYEELDPAPAVTATWPVSGAVDVNWDATLVVTFTEAVAQPTCSDYLTLTLEDGTPVPGARALRMDGGLIVGAVFTPTEDLSVEGGYRATVRCFEDLKDNVLTPSTWNFTANWAPRVASVTPAENAHDVPESTTISVTFDQAIQDPGSGEGVSLESAGGSIGGNQAAAGSTLVFTPTSLLTHDATYTATVQLVRDTDGLAMPEPVVWSFETGYTQPEVARVTPTNAAFSISWDAVVAITFTREVAQSAGCSAELSLETSGAAVAGTQELIYDGGTLVGARLTPSADLTEQTTYQADACFEDLRGNPLTHTWTFDTEDWAPRVVSVDPTGIQVLESTLVTVTFDQEVQGSSLGSQIEELVLEDKAGIGVDGELAFNGVFLIFTPTGDLESEMEYDVTVEGVRDLSGQTMAGTHTWSFITRDYEVPLVSGTSPADGETSAPLLATILVTMTECLAPEQADAELEVVGPDGKPICCWEMEFDAMGACNTEITWYGKTQLGGDLYLDPDTVYTATVQGIADKSGNLSDPHTWSFRTEEESWPAGGLMGMGMMGMGMVLGGGSGPIAEGVQQQTSYYYLGGRRVAMRVDAGGESTVYYLHGDHLGSTSLVVDDTGAEVARQLYYPYGEVRYGAGSLPTDFGYTGQRDVPSTGLMYYRARFYHPALGRFVSADTIVPEPGNPQDFNRYSYVQNNPINYVDPSGHAMEGEHDSYSVVTNCLIVGTCEPPSPERVRETAIFVGGAVVAVVVGPPLLDDLAYEAAWRGLKLILDHPRLAQVLRFLGLRLVTEIVDGDDDEIRTVDEFLRRREAYEEEVRAIGEEAERMLAEGQTYEEVARWAHDARRSLGIVYKNLTPPEFRPMIYARNIERYGDPLGPSIEQLRQNGSSWADIIRSAARPGGEDIIPEIIRILEGR